MVIDDKGLHAEVTGIITALIIGAVSRLTVPGDILI
jgi:hypothetical protein